VVGIATQALAATSHPSSTVQVWQNYWYVTLGWFSQRVAFWLKDQPTCYENGSPYGYAEHIATLQVYDNGQSFVPALSYETFVALPLAVAGPSENSCVHCRQNNNTSPLNNIDCVADLQAQIIFAQLQQFLLSAVFLQCALAYSHITIVQSLNSSFRAQRSFPNQSLLPRAVQVCWLVSRLSHARQLAAGPAMYKHKAFRFFPLSFFLSSNTVPEDPRSHSSIFVEHWLLPHRHCHREVRYTFSIKTLTRTISDLHYGIQRWSQQVQQPGALLRRP
jgi:hypothetical protein